MPKNSNIATWRIARLRFLSFITITSTAVISFSSVMHLAEFAGFGWLSSWFPITLDAVAACGMDIWMRRSKAQHIAGALALAAIGGSLAANVAWHYLSTGLVLAAILGAVPPIMLAWLLLTLHAHGTISTTRIDKTNNVKTNRSPITPPPEVITTPVKLELIPSASDLELIELARQEGHTTRRAIALHYHIGTDRAARIARLVKEGAQSA